MSEDARIKVERAPNRCPYCHDDVRVSDEAWVACSSCLARHHADCWTDAGPGKCASCGCEQGLEPPQSARLVSSAPAVDPILAAYGRPPRQRVVIPPREGAQAPPVEEPSYGAGPWVFAKLLVALGIGAAVYHALMTTRFGQTAALFVGLPAILAILLVVTPAPRTFTGTSLKIIALLLAVAGLLFNEGIVCILMAAPIFLATGLVVGLVLDELRRRSRAPLVVALPLVVLMSLEGTTPALTASRDEVVVAERVVDGTPDDVERRLASRPRFAHPLPLALALGFPRPTRSSGAGLTVGDSRRVHLVGGEGLPGDLVLRVEAHAPGFARFGVVSDRSHMPHYLDWEGAEVRWEPAGPGRTRVRWALRYTRRLDPSWYFGPCERWAAGLAVGYLADALTGPAQDGPGGVPDARGEESP